jgi:hypothetical protein
MPRAGGFQFFCSGFLLRFQFFRHPTSDFNLPGLLLFEFGLGDDEIGISKKTISSPKTLSRLGLRRPSLK